MRCRFLAIVFTLCLAWPLGVFAQERAAGGNLEVQANWTALKNMITAQDMKITGLTDLANAIKGCGVKGMIYAPGTAGIDGQGCKTAGGSLATTRVQQTYNAFRWPAGSVSCPAGTRVLSGGASCTSSIGWMFINRSYPNGNGWFASCDTPEKVNATLVVFAECAVL